VKSRYRGGFISINSAVQQFASGLPAFVSGRIIGETVSGAMTRYGQTGWLAVAMAFVGIYLVRFLTPHPENLSDVTPMAIPGEM